MPNNLFSKPPKYTIDSSCLMDIFGDGTWVSKDVTPGLWKNISDLITEGTIISHAEVLKEIRTDGKRGVELYDWAQKNKDMFLKHRPHREGLIIRSMTNKYSDFVNAKIGDAHADPWLIAQAKCDNLAIITEELYSASPNSKKWTIPNVCQDPSFSIRCLNLFDLAKDKGWKFN